MTPTDKPHSNVILAIDDVETNIHVLTKTLKSEGYEILAALTGEKGISIAERRKPDLILLDVAMPIMNGFEVCTKLKANPITKDIPIIFVTADAHADAIAAAYSAGGVDYVVKPFHKDELVARIRTHLRLQAAQTQLALQNENLEQKIIERTAELQTTIQQLHEEIKKREIIQNERDKSIEIIKKFNKQQSDFVTLISHEFRTPLTIVHASFDIIRLISQNHDIYHDTRFTKGISGIEKGLHDIQRITESVDRLNQVQSIISSNTLVPVPILQHMQMIVNHFHERHSESSIAFNTYGCDETIHVMTHIRLLEIMLTELFDNALKYSSHPQSVTVSLTLSNNEAVITISDNGYGIPQSTLETLFKVFQRGQNEMELGTKRGLGIGLGLVGMCNDAMNGNIEVQSEIGKGTSFIISLPIVVE